MKVTQTSTVGLRERRRVESSSNVRRERHRQTGAARACCARARRLIPGRECLAPNSTMGRKTQGYRPLMMRGLQLFIHQWRRERPDVDLTAFVIAGAITQIFQQTEAEFRRLATSLDIAPGDLRILFALRRSGVENPKRPTDLFQSLLISSGAVTKQVDRLEAKGLAKRLPDPSYQRGALIRLTARGAKVADAAIEAICSRETSIGAAVANLTDEEREIGTRFLQRFLAQFDRPDAPAKADEGAAPIEADAD